MRKRFLDNERTKETSLYITAAALSVLILYVFLKLWRADLRIPFYYGEDSLLYSVFTKGIVDNGWYWQNPFIGAPGGLQIYAFPTFDNGVGAFYWLCSLFTHNTGLITNLFYLFSFPLITLASLYVFRHFNVAVVPALFCSLLYAFSPYHFMRNQIHLVQSAYYVIPLAILVVLWITTQELFPRTKKFLIAVLICLLLGSSGVYHPFFFCYLLLIGGAIGSLKLRKFRPIATALVFIGITSVTVAINLSPSLIHRYRYGDVGVLVRNPGEVERYGLKISQLVMPITGHRIPLLDRLKRYHNRYTATKDSEASSLGLVATIGFLGLLAQLLHRKELIQEARGLFQDLSTLNIFAVLLAIVGGLSYLFALFVSTAMRSFNRISIFIAFLSLMAVALGLDAVYRKTKNVRTIFYLLAALAFFVAFLDQTTPGYVPDYAAAKADFLNDEEFVNRIEASVPAGAMIFQLPYVPFIEEPPVHRMDDYDHIRGYVHSKNLHWSYGTVKKGDGDRVQQIVAALPTEEFVQTLAFAGFSGIYLDRYGYEDNGAAKEAELTQVVQTSPLISANGRLIFFNITDYSKRLRVKYSDSEWAVKRDLSFHPVLLDWKGGFFELESRPGKTWRWCSSEGELHLRNLSQRPRTIKLEMSFATGHERLDDFVISGLISEQLKVNSAPTFYSKTVTVLPGESVISFRSTAERVDAPLDSRTLVFRIEDFKMTELP